MKNLAWGLVIFWMIWAWRPNHLCREGKKDQHPIVRHGQLLKINIMAEEISISELIKKLFDQIKAYYKLRLGYLRLYVAEYLIRFFSSLVLWMVIFLFLFFVLVFSSFAFAYWFGELTGRWSAGFLIIAGFYVLLAVLIFAFRRHLIVKPFTQLIIKQMELDKFNDLDNEKEDE